MSKSVRNFTWKAVFQRFKQRNSYKILDELLCVCISDCVARPMWKYGVCFELRQRYYPSRHAIGQLLKWFHQY